MKTILSYYRLIRAVVLYQRSLVWHLAIDKLIEFYCSLDLQFQLFRFDLRPVHKHLDFWLLMLSWAEGHNGWILFGITINEYRNYCRYGYEGRARLVIILLNYHFEYGVTKKIDQYLEGN